MTVKPSISCHRKYSQSECIKPVVYSTVVQCTTSPAFHRASCVLGVHKSLHASVYTEKIQAIRVTLRGIPREGVAYLLCNKKTNEPSRYCCYYHLVITHKVFEVIRRLAHKQRNTLCPNVCNHASL